MIRYIVSLQVQNGIRNVRWSYQGTKNVAIYAFSSGKFLNIKVYACVKDLTNIMSESFMSDIKQISSTQKRMAPFFFSQKIQLSKRSKHLKFRGALLLD